MAQTLSRTLILLCFLVVPTFAATVYSESVNGDLSSNGLSPTLITLTAGSNQIIGKNGNQDSAVRDYLTFTVPSGYALTSITLLGDTIGNVGFLGLQAGNQVTLPTNTSTAAGLLGWWHYTPANIGANLLPLMAAPANGSSGFAPPLGPGAYSLWIQESSPGLFTFDFDLVLTQVPEPATWLLTALGAGLLGLGRKTRS